MLCAFASSVILSSFWSLSHLCDSQFSLWPPHPFLHPSQTSAPHFLLIYCPLICIFPPEVQSSSCRNNVGSAAGHFVLGSDQSFQVWLLAIDGGFLQVTLQLNQSCWGNKERLDGKLLKKEDVFCLYSREEKTLFGLFRKGT